MLLEMFNALKRRQRNIFPFVYQMDHEGLIQLGKPDLALTINLKIINVKKQYDARYLLHMFGYPYL